MWGHMSCLCNLFSAAPLPEPHVTAVRQQRPSVGLDTEWEWKRSITTFGFKVAWTCFSYVCSFLQKTACVYRMWEVVYIVETELFVFDKCFF